MFKLVSLDAFKEAKGENSPEVDGLLKGVVPVGKEINTENRSVSWIITSDAVDRDNDTVNTSGWELDNYLKNPVVLWAHDYKALPVGKALTLQQTDSGLKSMMQFPTKEESPFADTVFNLVKGGYLNAVSVGFKPKEWDFAEDDEKRPYGIDFKRQELLEYSIVPVPSNPNALIEARAKGIDLTPIKSWAERVLDTLEGSGAWVKNVENSYNIASADTKPFILLPNGVKMSLDSVKEEKKSEENIDGVVLETDYSYSEGFSEIKKSIDELGKLFQDTIKQIEFSIKSLNLEEDEKEENTVDGDFEETEEKSAEVIQLRQLSRREKLERELELFNVRVQS